MNLRKLLVLAVAAAFAAPLGLQAADNESSGTSGGSPATSNDSSTAPSSSPSSAGASTSPSDDATFKALDKNNDGYLTPDELSGTPQEKDFSKLDSNNDGKISQDEWNAGASSTSGSSASSPSGSKY